MHKVWIVARREYTVNLRRPAFLFAAFGVPLLIVVIMVLMTSVISNSETDTASLGQIGFVDQAGLIAQAEAPFEAYTDETAARQALDDGAIGAYFVIPANYLTSGRVTITSNRGVPEALHGDISHLLVENLSANIQQDVPVDRIASPVTLTVRPLDRNRDFSSDAVVGLFMLPVMFTIVFFISAQTSSSYLMSSVVEEKTSRVVEILITSVTPLELLAGKILGLGALGLTQLLVWVGFSVAALHFGQSVPILSGVEIPPDLIVLSLVYFLAAYVLFAGVLAGIGAISNSEQESRQLAGIFSLAAAVPFFFFTTFIFNPDSALAVALTLIPFTAPLAVIMRSSLGVLPAWQLVLSLALMIGTAALVIWMSARLFRWSLLMYGKRPTPRELWRVIRGGQTPIVRTAEERTR